MSYNQVTPILQAKNLAIGHGQDILLNDLSFEIFAGETICLMGTNGCGKTTLLRTLSNLLPSLDGEIFINGVDLKNLSIKELATKISIVLTDKADLPHLKTYDVAALGRFPYTNFWGQLSSTDKYKIDEAFDLLDIRDLKEMYYNELSDGQKQKILIARAIVQDTPLLFLDEPTTFLDIPRKMELIQILRKISFEKNKAILFSSHDWELVLEMINLTWIVDQQGNLVKGMPEELILEQKIKNCFEHHKFQFNDQLGSFEEVNKFSKKIILTGNESTRKFWTLHALQKNGFKTVDISEKELAKIEVKKDHWCFNAKEFTSLNTLLKETANSIKKPTNQE